GCPSPQQILGVMRCAPPVVTTLGILDQTNSRPLSLSHVYPQHPLRLPPGRPLRQYPFSAKRRKSRRLDHSPLVSGDGWPDGNHWRGWQAGLGISRWFARWLHPAERQRADRLERGGGGGHDGKVGRVFLSPQQREQRN